MNGDKKISEFLLNQTFIAFDTETTGIWAPVNHLVELSAVKFSLIDGEIGVFDHLILPGRKIPEEVIKVHGITDEMVKGKPKAPAVLKEFIPFCGEDSILIAHNAPFDISFVGNEIELAKLEFGENLIIDTVDIYHRYFPDLESYSLLNLVKHFKMAQSQDHRALSDARFVMQLFMNAVDKFPEINSNDDIKKAFTVYGMNDVRCDPSELPAEYSDITYAIENDMRLEIQYTNPMYPEQTRKVRPRRVHKLGSHYYLGCYCEHAGADRTFRLDRIKSYKVLAD